MQSKTFLLLILPLFSSIITYAQFSPQKLVTPFLQIATSAHVMDMDKDGDLDVFSASREDDKIAWYENDGAGNFGKQKIISQWADGAKCVYAIDLDGDGDTDVLSASENDNKVAWYENIGNNQFGKQQTIDEGLSKPQVVVAMDIDNDDRIDVIAGGNSGIEGILWYKNQGGGTFEKMGSLDDAESPVAGLRDIHLADMNQDGFLDVLSASAYNDKVAYYQNTGTGSFENQQIISTNSDYAWSVFAADLDNDGDLEILSSANIGNKISWYENLGDGQFGEENAIYGIERATSVFATDFDNDGDADILASKNKHNQIVWLENNGDGQFESPLIIKSFSSPNYVFGGDFDTDGDTDFLVLGGSLNNGQIKWFPNDGAGNFGVYQTYETVIDGSRGVKDICMFDANQDGHLDLLSTGADKKITWYPNTGKGQFPEQRIIHKEIEEEPSSVFAGDMDGDGDTDILAASGQFFDNKIIWFANDGAGNFGDANTIFFSDHSDDTPIDVHADDLDGDGDLDVLSINFIGNTLSWYANDGTGNFSLQQTIQTSSSQFANDILTTDIDHDGDVDILAGFRSENGLVWYENDGTGNFTKEHIIENTTFLVESIFVVDMDKDGDTDLLAAVDRAVTWFENDGQGNFENKYIIEENIISLESVYAMDVEGDGDLDILATYGSKREIVWYENTGEEQFNYSYIISTDMIPTISLEGPNKIIGGDLDGDGDTDILSASYNYGKIAWHENLFNHSQIVSFAFQDLNQNGTYEEHEPSLLNQKKILQPSADETFTNQQGYTYFFTDYGEYQLTYQPSTLWEITTDHETYDILHTQNTTLPVYQFGFKPTRILPRVEPHLNSSPTRCSTQSTYWLHYSNTGTTIANGTITLEVDELMDFITSNPEPDAIEGHNLIWHFSELYPSFQNKIELQFQMPDFNSMGEILETQASLQLVNENGELIYTESTDYNSEVLCSYDPNDKLVRSNLLGQSETAYINDTLQYTIRFQNTGNDTAFNIRIEDVLDKTLDWTTFHPITASHDYRTELNRETGLVTFYFDDIMLPDSTINEPHSHGFVLFGIASLPDIGDKIEVENTASIFFDFNPPIITNTVSTVLIELDDVNIGDSVLDIEHSILIRPNPFSDYTTIEVEGLPEGKYQLEVMDILGRKVRTLTLEGGKVRLERGKLESGVYLIRVLKEGNSEVIGGGKVLVE